MPASPQLQARLAGLVYLIIIVAGVWSEMFVRSALVVPGDPAATAAAVIANEGLFRLSLAADAVMAVSDVALAVLLFVLLRPAGPTLALTAMVFRLIQTAIIGANLLNQNAALLLVGSAGQAAGLGAADANALALHFLELHGQGYDLGLIFFGINSLLVGWLVIRAQYLPSFIGVGLLAAGAVYLTGSFSVLLAPSLTEALAPAYLVPLLAEAAFCLWLLLRGINPGRWALAGAPAAT